MHDQLVESIENVEDGVENGTIEWVCRHFPDRVQSLLAALDPDNAALSAVRDAVEGGHPAEACRRLLDYYLTSKGGLWLRHDPVAEGEETDPAAESMADDYFPLPGGQVQIPRLPSGNMNWGYQPPEAGGYEWGFGVNRHDYMRELLEAFYETGNRRYVRSLNRHLFDWCSSITAPAKPDTQIPWGSILEAGHRAKAWPAVFYGLQHEPEFRPATRILVLSQALDHARFLQKFHSSGTNWVITEMAGLFSIACAWPEFRDAAEWRDLALPLIEEELSGQVYPDGAQKELSSNYQLAVLLHMNHFVATAKGAGLPLTPRLAELLEKMWNQLAYSLSPNGHIPHNGDSDRSENAGESQVIKDPPSEKYLADAARKYNRADWEYILTNGARGRRPDGLPSVLSPWAGQLVSRNGWDANAHWSFFDIGPWGVLHQQYDALHLSVTAHGRDLLVDSGRYTYQDYLGEPGSWRSYFVGSGAHNTVLVDGLGQGDGPMETEHPIGDDQADIAEYYDFAKGVFDGGYAEIATISARLKAILWKQPERPEPEIRASHSRAVLYIRNIAWLVLDRLESGQPRRFSTLWHFHPGCTVEQEGQDVVSIEEALGNLRIQPLTAREWDIELINGREAPDFQGWYSPEMDVRLPNTCVSYSAQGKSMTNAWLLSTWVDRVPAIPVEIHSHPDGALHCSLDLGAGLKVEVAMRLNDATPLTLLNGEALEGHCEVKWHQSAADISAKNSPQRRIPRSGNDF